MNTIQRLADARNCLEGKVVATVLSVLLTLSFLNVSAFAGTALAAEGFDQDVAEPTVASETASQVDPDTTIKRVSENGSETPETSGATEGDKEPASETTPEGDADDTAADSSATVLGALTAQANDGVTVRVAPVDHSSLPAGATLKVETAFTDKVTEAVRANLGEGLSIKGGVAYSITLLDEDGQPLAVDEPLMATIVNPLGATMGLSVFAINGEEARELALETTVVPDPTELSFIIDGAPSLVALLLTEPAAPEENEGPEDQSPEVPGTTEGDNQGGADVVPPSGSDEPKDPNAGDGNDNPEAPEVPSGEETSLVMYVGESRSLVCNESHVHEWKTENTGTSLRLTGINQSAVTVEANKVCDAVVSCGGTRYNVSVRALPAETGEQLAYFYFVPAEEGGSAIASKAQFLGSGSIVLPDGYTAGKDLYEGTLCGDVPVSLESMIVGRPTDREIRLGLASYYKDVIDNETKRPHYDDSWTYSYAPYLIKGPLFSSDNNGVSLERAYHVYVQMSLNTNDRFAVSYQVNAPAGTKLATAFYEAGESVTLPTFNDEGDKLTVGETTFSRVLTAGNREYVFDGWYTDATYRTKAPASYEAAAPTTFYARYIAVDAPVVTFDPNGGAFAGNQKESKAISVNEGSRYWLVDAPTRYGYEFEGWVAENGAMKQPGDSAIMGSEAVTYIAQWKGAPATFEFNAMGGKVATNGTPDAVASYNGYTGQSTEDLELPIPVRPGFKFAGWYANESLGDGAIQALPSEFAAGKTTYYAKWVADPSQRAEITYRSNLGGRVCRGETALTFGNAFYDTDIYPGAESNIRGCTVKVLPGYMFVGWFKVDPQGAGEGEKVSEFTNLDVATVKQHLNKTTLENNGECYEDTVFEARFAINNGAIDYEDAAYEIEYYLMNADGSYPDSPSLVVKDKMQCYPETLVQFDKSLNPVYRNVPEVIDGKATGYKADDYRRDKTYAGQITECLFAPADSDAPLVFKVCFERRMTVKFASDNRGALLVDGKPLAADENGNTVKEYAVWPEDNLPQAPEVDPKAGYEFAGWYFEGRGNAGDTLHEDEMVSYDRVYTATYNALGASIELVSPDRETVTIKGETDEAIEASVWPTMERAGYTFEGWYANEDFAGEPVTLPEAFPAGKTTYYAKWSANKASIVFDKNAQNALGSQEGAEGVTDGPVPGVSLEPGYTRSGYVFAGWNTQADGKGATVTELPETFAPGTTTYYAQWKLDVEGLDATDFSATYTYDGRAHGIKAAAIENLMKDGETVELQARGVKVSDRFALATNVADSAANLKVIVRDKNGNELKVIDGVSVTIKPATLKVTTSSIIYPFDGNAATSAGMTVTGLQNGETLGYRTTGQAFQVGDEVANTFELIWADEDGAYTAQSANYSVVSSLGTIRVVSSACPVTIEGYVGVYDGQEHAITYTVADEEKNKARVTFDAPTAYTNAGNRTINFTVDCDDHGTYTGSIDLKILPRPVTIAVEDSFKVVSTLDPQFKGAIVEGNLVNETDLGAITFGRTNDAEEVGFYPEVLTANYLRNANYDVRVIPGTFTIGPAGSVVVPPKNPLLPQRPYSSLGAGMPEGSNQVVNAAAAVVTTLAGPERARAMAAGFGTAASVILDEEVPMAGFVSFDDEQPTVKRIGGEETIEDDATALGAFDEPHCWVHWVMALGILLTVAYAAVVVARRLGYARKIGDFDDRLTGKVTTEETRAARAARTA